VIEHDYSWKEILDNAVNSFTRKFCLVLFTPFGPETREIAHNRAHGVDVPDLSFCRADIERRFAGLRWELFDNIPTDTGYGVEHVYLVWRPGQLPMDVERQFGQRQQTPRNAEARFAASEACALEGERAGEQTMHNIAVAQRKVYNANLRAMQAEAKATQAQIECEQARQERDALLSCTLWKATWPLRIAGQRLPPGLRRVLRVGAKLTWWSLTLKLPRKLRERRQSVASRCAPPIASLGCKYRRALVYTAIFGGHDALKPVPAQDMPCDFVCFTDEAAALRGAAHGWRIIEVHRTSDNPRMQAKWFKLMSHRICPGGRLALRYDLFSMFRPRYDAIVWVDGSISIKSASFVRELTESIGPSGWVVFKHPDRDCIYEECAVSASMLKYTRQPIAEQVSHYRGQGHPPHAGLFACGIIARSVRNNPRLHALNEAWWAENRRWSYQDQLSLPYLLRRFQLGVDLVPYNLWHNDWFDHLPHNSDT
jgi:hypothetical protein